MCLAALAFHRSRRYPLVLAANRDEFHARETAAMDWWQADPSRPWTLSGRDLQAGGTWFGLNANGRWALLTNIRSAAKADPAAPSRGTIVSDWLSGRQPIDKFWMRTGLSGHNGFNLIAAQWAPRRDPPGWDCHWLSSAPGLPRRLEAGLHGLSNGTLDEPWPKVVRLKARLAEAIDTADGADQLAGALLDSLQDRTLPHDADLPLTGVPLDIERALGAVFVHMPGRGYGTRSSHVLIAERVGASLVLHLVEQRYDAAGHLVEHRRACLEGWPSSASSDEAPKGVAPPADMPPRHWSVLADVPR